MMFDYILEIDYPEKDMATVYQYRGNGKTVIAFMGKIDDAIRYAEHKQKTSNVFIESEHYLAYNDFIICIAAEDYEEQTGKRYIDYWTDKKPKTIFEMTHGLIDSELKWSVKNIIQFGADDTLVNEGMKEYIRDINKTILKIYKNDKEKALKGIEDMNKHIVKHRELEGVPNSREEADFKIPEEFIYKPLGELFFLLQETQTVLE